MKNNNHKIMGSFLKIMLNNKKEINNIIPNGYIDSIYDLNFISLLSKGYRNIICDIDNTILPTDDINVNEKMATFFIELNKYFKLCLISNNNEKRVKPVADKLGIPYANNANKPSRRAFDKALYLLNGNRDNTIMIGDQMLTDIKGANEYGLYSILVNPISNKHNRGTKFNQILQKIIVKKLTRKNLFTLNRFYIGDKNNKSY